MTTASVTDEMYLYIFTTAIEGGINYWAYVNEYHWSHGRGLDDDYKGFYATIVDAEDDDNTEYRIDRKVIAKGYKMAAGAEGDKVHWSTGKPPLVPNEDWDYDAFDADMIVQLGLFGEVVYG